MTFRSIGSKFLLLLLCQSFNCDARTPVAAQSQEHSAICEPFPVDWKGRIAHFSNTSLISIANSAERSIKESQALPESVSEASELILKLVPDYFLVEVIRAGENAKDRVAIAREWEVSPEMEARLFSEIYVVSLMREGFAQCLPASLSDDERRLVVLGFIEHIASVIASHWGLRDSPDTLVKRQLAESGIRNVTEGVLAILQLAVQKRVSFAIEEDAVLALYSNPCLGNL